MTDTPETTQNAAQDTSAPAAATPIPAHTAAAATGVLSRLESDVEKELAKGETSFKNWFKSAVAELKEHLKV